MDEKDNRTIHYVQIFGEDFQEVLNEEIWNGDYIPVVRVLGYQNLDENGDLTRYGHVRDMIDPQKRLNRAIFDQADFMAQTTETTWLICDDGLDPEQKEIYENLNTVKPRSSDYIIGKDISYSYIAHEIHKIAKYLSIDFQLRDIRAKSATDMNKKYGLSYAQKLLGHTSSQITSKVYIRTDGLGEVVQPMN